MKRISVTSIILLLGVLILYVFNATCWPMWIYITFCSGFITSEIVNYFLLERPICCKSISRENKV